jgi:Na+-driven multidrug efflux pump
MYLMENEEKLGREILKVAWPIIVSGLGDSIYSLTDTYFVSKIGTDALAAVGLGSYLYWLFFVVVALFATGVLVYVSQAYGGGELDKAKRGTGESSLLSAVIASAVVAASLPFVHEIMWALSGQEGPLTEMASAYFIVRILSLPVVAVVISMDSAIRAIGATRLSMIATLSLQ